MRAKCAPVSKWRVASPRSPSVCSETATAGLPRKRPSVAAATVPEYNTSSPRFEPSLMPDTTMSGSKGNSPETARCTQSVGVPCTKYTSGSAWLTRSGNSSVRELLAPLRLRSGATTVRSPRPLRPSRSAMNAARAVTVVVGYEDSHRRAIYSMHQRGGSLSGKRTDPEADVFREAMRDVKPIARARARARGQAQAAGQGALHRGRSRHGAGRKPARGSAKVRSPTPATRSRSAVRACRTASCASSSAANIASKTSATCTACASTKPRPPARIPGRSAGAPPALRAHHPRQGQELGPQGPGDQDRGQHDPAQDGAGAGVHLGAPRRRRHRRHQRVAVRADGHDQRLPKRDVRQRFLRNVASGVPASPARTTSPRPSRRTRARGRAASSGVPNRSVQVAARHRAGAQHGFARQCAEFARDLERARRHLRCLAKLVDQSDAQRRRRIDQRTAREQLRGMTAHQAPETRRESARPGNSPTCTSLSPRRKSPCAITR